MKISSAYLKHFIHGLPQDAQELRALCDDVGLEVKKTETVAHDAVMTLELLANRGDHHAYAGVARELYGRDQKTTLPALPQMQLSPSDLPIKIEVLTDKVLSYAAVYFELSPKAAATLAATYTYPLEIAEINPISLVVDVTNLVNIELGQPLHAFDMEKIAGKVIVRTARANEQAYPLGASEPLALPEGVIVIADDEKILAIAGVIGCEESKVTSETRKILMESAVFDPIMVRQCSQKIKIRTLASARFEKGGDLSLPIVALQRACGVLSEHHAFNTPPQIAVIKKSPLDNVQILFNLEQCNQFFAIDMPASEAKLRLERYAFHLTETTPGTFKVIVPASRKWDVSRVEDLYEEIARSVGYNALPEALYIGAIETTSSVDEKIKEKINPLLVATGFYEHFTDAFYGPQLLEKLGIQEGDALYQHVHINNAIEKHYALLKNNCVGNALQIVYDNFRFGVKDLKIFEWTRIFHPGTTQHPGCNEIPLLWGVVVGQRTEINWQDKSSKVDIFYLKGIVENIAKQLQCQFDFAPLAADLPTRKLFHPFRAMSIMLGKTVVGVLGELHPKIIQAFDIKQARPIYFEIYPEKLHGHIFQPQPLVLPPALPPIERNLSFVIPRNMMTHDIIDFIVKKKYDKLQEIIVMDIYAASPHSETISVMLRLMFENTFGLTSDNLNQICESLVGDVENKFKNEGVHLRT